MPVCAGLSSPGRQGMEALDISIIVPCRNAMPFLPWAMDDLARSTGCRLEVLVCDDGSTDASGAWLGKLYECIAEGGAPGHGSHSEAVAAVEAGGAVDDPVATFGEASRAAAPPVDLVRQEAWPGECDTTPPAPAEVAARFIAAGHAVRLLASGGRGQGTAQNLCLAAATAPLISLMDADDRCPADRFSKLRSALQANHANGWDAACSSVCIFGAVSAGMARYINWQNSLLDPSDLLANRFVEIPALHQSGLYPRHILCDVLHGYRDLPDWPIDMDTWMRLAEAGVRVGKIPDQLYGWRQHVLQSTRNHGRCSLEHLRSCKAHFLLRSLPPEVHTIEVWSVGQTLEAWARALEEALARALAADLADGGCCAPQERTCVVVAREATRRQAVALRLVEWQPRRRRCSTGLDHSGLGRCKRAQEENELGWERMVAEPGFPPPPEPKGGGQAARIFVFGSVALREQARRLIGASGAARWAQMDWPAA